MNKLAELEKHLADLKGQGLIIIEAAEAGDRDLSPEEQDDLGAIEAKIADTQSKIDNQKALQERRRTMEAIPSAYGRNAVHDANPATTFGFNDMAEFAVAVRQASTSAGARDSRLMAAPTNTHEGGAASGEGFEVPPDFRAEIFDIVTELDEFGPLVDEEPTMSRQVEKNVDETTPWSASGVQARWRNEGSQMTADKMAQEPRVVPLHQLYAFVTATEELLEDAPRLAQRLTRKAGEAIAWKKNDAMVNGTGTGQPLGWMNSDALLTIAKESGQAADTLSAANVLKMYSRLLSIPGDAPFWLANKDTVPELATMTIGDKPVWMPPNGLMDAPGGMLMGLPVRFSEHAKTLGDKGDLQLISPKGYYALRRESGPKFAQSMHLYFDYAVEAFRWTFRFGGQPHLSAPVSPANGSSTKSHFVALAERA